MTGGLNRQAGGSIYQKNGIVRTYKSPSNPQTAAQLAQRAVFNAAVDSWSNTLTEAQRAAYVAAAASGEWNFQDDFTGTSRKVSGQNLYISLYMNVYAAGGTPGDIDNLPTKVSTGDAIITTLTVAAGAGTASLAYTGTLESNQVFEIFATAPMSSGKSVAPGGAYRSILIGTGASPINIAAAYVAKFGSLTGTAGKKIFIKAVAILDSTGQRREAGGTFDVIAA